MEIDVGGAEAVAVGCHLGIEPEQVVAIGALLDLLELSDQAALDAQRPARKMRSTRETAKRTTFNRFAEAKTTAASLSTRIIFRNGVASWHANQAVLDALKRERGCGSRCTRTSNDSPGARSNV